MRGTRGGSQADPTRVLIAELDSLEQARIFAESPGNPAAAITRITGMLRAALFLSDTVLISDSMLLDGLYFAHVSPSELAATLGVDPHRLPLIVLSSHTDLSLALEQKKANHEFVWQLEETELTEAAIEQHWESWTDAAASGSIKIQKWGAVPADSRTGSFIGDHQPPHLGAIPDELKTLLLLGVSAPARSDFFSLLNEARGIASPEHTVLLNHFQQWWNARYLDKLAELNNASWIRFLSEGNPLESTSPNRKVLNVSGIFLANLGGMSPALYAVVYESVTKQRVQFVEHPSSWRLRNLIFAATNLLEAPSRPRVLRSSVFKVLFAGLAILLAVPNLDIAGVDGIGLAWLAFAVGALLSLPFGELMTLWTLAKSSTKAQLSVAAS